VVAKQQPENLQISTDLLKGTRNRRWCKVKMREGKIEPPVINNSPPPRNPQTTT